MFKTQYLILIIFLLCGCEEKENYDMEEPDKDKEQTQQIAEENIMIEVIKEAVDKIKQEYYFEIDEKLITKAALKGLFSSLDQFSEYLSEEEYKKTINSSNGEILGIGIEIESTADGMKILDLISNSPAGKAGLKIGDLITHINGEPVRNINETDVSSKLTGSLGKKVSLKINRIGEKKKIELSIALVRLDEISTLMDNNILLIKVPYISEKTVGNLRTLLTKKKKYSKKNIIKGLILDMRDNLGGSLEQAIKISDMFLKNKVIVKISQKKSETDQNVFSNGVDLAEGLPMVVLINRRTASGAEIIAAALKDNARAVIVGERSFGKGSIQSLFRIPGFGALKLTTGVFFGPNGVCISEKGIKPNITVNDSNESVYTGHGDYFKKDICVKLSVKIINEMLAKKTGQAAVR